MCSTSNGKNACACRVGQELVAVHRSHEAGEVGVFLYVTSYGLRYFTAGVVIRFFNAFSFCLLSSFSWSSMLMNRYSAISVRMSLLRVYLSGKQVVLKRCRAKGVQPPRFELPLPVPGQHQTSMVLTPRVIHGVGYHTDKHFVKYSSHLPGLATCTVFRSLRYARVRLD